MGVRDGRHLNPHPYPQKLTDELVPKKDTERLVRPSSHSTKITRTRIYSIAKNLFNMRPRRRTLSRIVVLLVTEVFCCRFLNAGGFLQESKRAFSARAFSELYANSAADTDKTRRMKLVWCGKENCKDVVRERVVGDYNQVLLDGPATGQVAYHWTSSETHQPSVLFFIRPGDEELLQITANAIKNLTEAHNVKILLDPTTAARFEHKYNVDGQSIHLFEPQCPPGFGSHVKQEEVIHCQEMMDLWRTSGDCDQLPSAGEKAPDLIVTVGGDGLLMHASMLFQTSVPPILAIAGGSLGFLTPFETSEMVQAIEISLGLLKEAREDDKINGDVVAFPPNMPSYPYRPLERVSIFGNTHRICLSIRMRLECRVINRQGDIRARYNVLNEVVIDRGSSPYLASLECFCDDEHLTTVQADGIIFATPTGSTAYSMAAGGSVVHPAVPCILVTPICPHVLSFRSMVFPDHVVLRCYVPDDARSEASVAFDGKHRLELRRGDSVQIQMSSFPVPTINRKDHSADWLGSLKRNFNFNTRPRQRPL